MTHPLFATACYAVVLVVTHLTGFVPPAPAEPWLHRVEEVLYLAAGCLFATPLVAWEPLWWRPPYPARFGLVLLSMAVDTVVGIVLMMSPGPADLHLAGAIMWLCGDGWMMVVALVIAAQWLRDTDRFADTGARLAYNRVLAAPARADGPHRKDHSGRSPGLGHGAHTVLSCHGTRPSTKANRSAKTSSPGLFRDRISASPAASSSSSNVDSTDIHRRATSSA